MRSRSEISNRQYFDLIDSKKNKKDEETCNTNKVECTACESKCKTRGVVLIVMNCGIVMSFAEIFCAESLPQISMLFLDTIDQFKGVIDKLFEIFFF